MDRRQGLAGKIVAMMYSRMEQLENDRIAFEVIVERRYSSLQAKAKNGVPMALEELRQLEKDKDSLDVIDERRVARNTVLAKRSTEKVALMTALVSANPGMLPAEASTMAESILRLRW